MKPENTYSIYSLHEGLNVTPKFIGVTNGLTLTLIDSGTPVKGEWIRSAMNAMIDIRLRIIESGLTKENAYIEKRRLVKALKAAGKALPTSPKKRISPNKGRKASEETKAKMRRKRTDEQRRNISEGHKGLKRVFTAEHIANMKKARKRLWEQKKMLAK